MPDYFLNKTVFCACNDTAFGIPSARALEGLAGAGLWCTGTLLLLDASNEPFVVYNPYAECRPSRPGATPTWRAQVPRGPALAAMQGYVNNDVQAVFFSPGGRHHQTMDGIFMGPYTKVHYWPGDSQGWLSVPAWYRDLNGSTRALDSADCFHRPGPALLLRERRPPVGHQVLLAAGDRQELADHHRRRGGCREADILAAPSSAWGDTATSECVRGQQDGLRLLQSGREQLAAAGPQDAVRDRAGGPGAPEPLRPAPDLLLAGAQEPSVWTHYLDQAILDAYHWAADPTGPGRPSPSGRRYSGATSPLRQHRGPLALGDRALAPVPLALSQLFFTLPMQPAGGDLQPPNLPELGGIEGLDAFVRAAVNQAYLQSPLYRHYNVSYVSTATSHTCTPSRACAGRAAGGRCGRGALLRRRGDPPQHGHPARVRHHRLPPLRVLLRLAGGGRRLLPAGGGQRRPPGAVPVLPS